MLILTRINSGTNTAALETRVSHQLGSGRTSFLPRTLKAILVDLCTVPPGPVSADHKPGEKSPTVPPAGSTQSRKSEPLLSRKEGGGEGEMEGKEDRRKGGGRGRRRVPGWEHRFHSVDLF